MQNLKDQLTRVWQPIKNEAAACSLAAAVGTLLALGVLLLLPLAAPVSESLNCYLAGLDIPRYMSIEIVTALTCLAVAAHLAKLPGKCWRSLRLGLIPFPPWIWLLSFGGFWLLVESRRAKFAWLAIAVPGLLWLTARLLVAPHQEHDGSRLIEPDVPLPEDGEDLLERGEIAEELAHRIWIDQPPIIAVTGGYGDGKTSLLNLSIGKLKKLGGNNVPVIVRFSPWLAADSNSLVLSLLNSVVAAIGEKYIVPGLGLDAAQYARVMLNMIPKADSLKEVFAEPSQEERISKLAQHIAKTQRRVLVVLDDLDRMDADELETVFKILRGSDNFSTITFLCAFAPDEIEKILQASRPHQEASMFLEKFFPVKIALPEIDPDALHALVSRKIANIVRKYHPSEDDTLTADLDSIWKDGGDNYFGNLRTIKVFFNGFHNAIERIAPEINIADFIRLELIREIAPALYNQIYKNPEHFYNQEFAFEARFAGPFSFENDKEDVRRTEFYKKVSESLSGNAQYVLRLVEALFPKFSSSKQSFGVRSIDSTGAERARRICHPRYFRQYFLFKVPSEYFGEKEFAAFVGEVKDLNRNRAAQAFTDVFKSLVTAEFKRWHFMHRIEDTFDAFGEQAKRGLCVGMAQNSDVWGPTAFEFMIAARVTSETLERETDRAARREFLRDLIRVSTSDLYTLTLRQLIEKTLKDAVEERRKPKPNPDLFLDLEEIKECLEAHLRQRYLGSDPPSAFKQFASPNTTGIDPIVFLFEWNKLSDGAKADERQYLASLLASNPEDLNQFLKSMFRVDFIDDYSNYKHLIDYEDLSELIAANEDKLDASKVQQFRQRREGDKSASEPDKLSGA